MKVFSWVVWLAWAIIGGRILLSPVLSLTFSDGLFLLVVWAPAVGLLSCVRWLFRPSQAANESEAPQAPAPAPPSSPAPQTDPVPKPRPESRVKPVRVQVF